MPFEVKTKRDVASPTSAEETSWTVDIFALDKMNVNPSDSGLLDDSADIFDGDWIGSNNADDSLSINSNDRPFTFESSDLATFPDPYDARGSFVTDGILQVRAGEICKPQAPGLFEDPQGLPLRFSNPTNQANPQAPAPRKNEEYSNRANLISLIRFL
jgi:hypothetical protein